MKKILFIFIIFFMFPMTFLAKEVSLDLFYGKECPHCHEEMRYIDFLEKQFGSNIKVNKYEVWHNKKNERLMNDVMNRFGVDSKGVPYLVIGNKDFLGYSAQSQRGIKKQIIKEMVSDDNIVLPILGKVNADKTNLVFTSFSLGVIDGFSICNLFVLAFGLVILFFINGNKKSYSLIFALFVTLRLGIFSFLNISFSFTILTIIRSFLAVVAVVIFALFMQKFIKNDNCLLNKIASRLHKGRFILFGLFSLCVGLLTIFVALRDPVLFKIMLDIRGASHLYLLLYLLGYFIFVYGILLIFCKITSYFDNKKYLVSAIMMLITFICLIYFPSLF